MSAHVKIVAEVHLPYRNITSTQTTHTHTSNTLQATNKNILIVQININGISNKHMELKQLAHTTQPDLITVQGTKLTTSKTELENYQHQQRQY